MKTSSAKFPENYLDVAATCAETRALGPGKRAVVWVQGCARNCPGCMSPEWQTFHAGERYSIPALLSELLQAPQLDGLTISGGEPMAQAGGLVQLVERLREIRPEMNVLCYTGYTLQEILAQRPESAPRRLLKKLDVLIDGAYRAEEDELRGLCGSRNQRVWHLSRRMAGYDFENAPRNSEFHILDGRIFMVGLPAGGVMAAFEEALERVQNPLAGVMSYERP